MLLRKIFVPCNISQAYAVDSHINAPSVSTAMIKESAAASVKCVLGVYECYQEQSILIAKEASRCLSFVC